jgi:hypothetical protein
MPNVREDEDNPWALRHRPFTSIPVVLTNVVIETLASLRRNLKRLEYTRDHIYPREMDTPGIIQIG